MMYVPDQGDIISIDFDPSAGREIRKRRPAYVLSKKVFNEHTGYSLVAPITSTVRGVRLEVVVPDGLPVKGAILVQQLRSLDWQARDAQLIGSVPGRVVAKVSEIARVIVS